MVAVSGVLSLLPNEISHHSSTTNTNGGLPTSPRFREDLNLDSTYGVGSTSSFLKSSLILNRNQTEAATAVTATKNDEDEEEDEVHVGLLSQSAPSSQQRPSRAIFGDEVIQVSGIDYLLGFVQYVVSGVPGVGLAMTVTSPASANTSANTTSNTSTSMSNMYNHGAYRQQGSNGSNVVTENKKETETKKQKNIAASHMEEEEKESRSIATSRSIALHVPLETDMSSSPPLSPSDQEWIQVNDDEF
jgi:hypothetical protein